MLKFFFVKTGGKVKVKNKNNLSAIMFVLLYFEQEVFF
jgi:hypothetical protein